MVRATASMCLVVTFLCIRAEVIGDDKADADKKTVAKVHKQLEGTWERTSLLRDGKEEALPEGKKILFSFKDGKGQLRLGEDLIAEGEFTIDPSKSPITVDIKLKQGPVMTGIMEIKGEMLTYCWARPGGERPTKFSGAEGSQQLLEKYKRAKP